MAGYVNGQSPEYQGLWQRYQQGPDGYSVGNKTYSFGFSNSPQVGGGLDPTGFAQRDQLANQKRAFLMKQLTQGGGFGDG